jgi:hypothetical protein
MGNNNAKPLESPLPPQSPQTQAAEATPPRQQLLQIFFLCFHFLEWFYYSEDQNCKRKERLESSRDAVLIVFLGG